MADLTNMEFEYRHHAYDPTNGWMSVVYTLSMDLRAGLPHIDGSMVCAWLLESGTIESIVYAIGYEARIAWLPIPWKYSPPDFPRYIQIGGFPYDRPMETRGLGEHPQLCHGVWGRIHRMGRELLEKREKAREDIKKAMARRGLL